MNGEYYIYLSKITLIPTHTHKFLMRSIKGNFDHSLISVVDLTKKKNSVVDLTKKKISVV